MAKIYNEIVIDMNPDSPTFEKTIHEDSYEYEGDMMLAQEGGMYMGGAQLEGEKNLSLRKLAAAIKKQQKKFKKGMGIRKLVGGGLDLFKKLVPGVGHVASFLGKEVTKGLTDIGSAKKIKQAQDMWTGEGYAEEFGKMKKEAEGDMFSSLLGEATSFLGSDIGGKALGGLKDKFAFTKLGKKLGIGGESGFNELLAMGKKKEVISPEGWSYQGGGYIDPETILDQHRTETDVDGKTLARELYKIKRPEGDRWYMGEQASRSSSMSTALAFADLINKITENPADSLVTGGLPIEEVLENLDKSKEKPKKKKKKWGLFEDGGMVQSEAPTIADYFGMQGKSLGGSNKQSVAEILGRK